MQPITVRSETIQNSIMYYRECKCSLSTAVIFILYSCLLRGPVTFV